MCENFTNYSCNIILFTEDTEHSLPVFIKPVNKFLLSKHILYTLLLLQVKNFFCDLNVLYEYLILPT